MFGIMYGMMKKEMHRITSNDYFFQIPNARNMNIQTKYETENIFTSD